MSKQNPKVSIVMVNYNGLNYLKRTIPRILDLDYPNYEFIVVDNGSSDGSIEFLKNKKEVRLIQSPRVSEKNYACNYAIKRAKGDYILLLDNDILINEMSILNNLLNGARSLNDFGAYSLAFFNEGMKKTKNYGVYLGYYYVKETRYLEFNRVKKMHNSEISSLHGIGIFIEKDMWEKLRGYEENLKFGGDDIDLGLRISLHGFKNYLYSKSLQKHIGLPERTDNLKYELKLKKNIYGNLYTITKNYSILNLYPTLIFYTIFAFFKSIKQSINRSNYGSVMSFFKGYYLFLKNIKSVLKRRKDIQSNRFSRRDVFLNVKPRII